MDDRTQQRTIKQRLAVVRHAEEVTGKVDRTPPTYHFGPLKISMYLKRYHDTEIGKSVVSGGSTPRLTGKVERSHRIDAEEFYRMLDGVVSDDTELFNGTLQEWKTSTTTTAN